MNMPGIDAESPLGPTRGLYRGKAVSGGSGGSEVLPMQEFLGSPTLSQNLVFPLITRCCRYAPLLGYWICESRAHSPCGTM
jgi:hypothetical protein